MQSGVASMMENITVRSLGMKPQFRFIDSGQRDAVLKKPPTDSSQTLNQSKAGVACDYGVCQVKAWLRRGTPGIFSITSSTGLSVLLNC